MTSTGSCADSRRHASSPASVSILSAGTRAVCSITADLSMHTRLFQIVLPVAHSGHAGACMVTTVN